MTKRSWLVVILLVAALFRFVGLTKAPPGLNWDEVSIGYNAYSLLKTGADEWGEVMPLSFKAFGENKLPGMIYASIPGIALLGTTDLGVRVTPAVLGIIAVYLVYLLAREIYKKEQVALIAGGLMAISPWAVHFSRVAFEAQLALVLTLIAIIALWRSRTNPRYLWGAMIAAVLAAYTYNAVRVLLPLLFGAYCLTGLISVMPRVRKTFAAVLLTGLLLCLPILTELSDPAGRVRLGTVSIASHKSFVTGIAESRGYTTLPRPLPQLIHNKYTHYAYQLSMNYLKTFSTEFLYLTGSSNSQRSVQGMGLLYLFELPLLIVGLIKLSSHKEARSLLLPLLLLSPLPSAMTIDAPSSVRALSLLPALMLIEGLGLTASLLWFKSRPAALTVGALFIMWSVAYFAYQLWYVNPVKYSDAWQYGYKQAIEYAGANYDTAERIYITTKYGEPYIFTLFYTGYDPQRFQTGKVERTVDSTGWVHVQSFDKYVFSDFAGLEAPSEIVTRGRGKLVLITAFAQLPGEYRRDLSIQAPNWEVMFEGTVQQGKQ